MVYAVHLAFFLPYTTGALSWMYANGVFPLRPALYMLGMGGILACLLDWKNALYAKSTFILLAFMFWRIVDAGLLERHKTPEGPLVTTFSMSSGMILLTLAVVSQGYWTRRGGGPWMSIAVGTLLIGSVINVAEYFGIGKFSYVPGRSAGFLVDSNDSAIAIIMGMVVILTFNKRFWWNAAALGIGFLGVFPTFSRSGILVFLLVTLAFLAMNFRQHSKSIFLMLGIATVLGIGVFSLMMAQQSKGAVKDANVQNRMAAIFGGDTSKMGSDERMKDLMDGINGAWEAPIFGHGVGEGSGAGRWQPHNQIVSIWIDLGMVGAGIYLLLLSLWTLKSILAGFNGLLCILPTWLFLPFTQMQLESPMVLTAGTLAALLTSPNPVQFRLLQPQPAQPRHAYP
jgi:hypothetical protein